MDDDNQKPARAALPEQNPQRDSVERYYNDVYADYCRDSEQVTNHLLRVAGLGAAVGGYILGAESSSLHPATIWFLVGAIGACLATGVLSALSYIFAQSRGEELLEITDKTLTDHHESRDDKRLAQGSSDARSARKKWDKRVNTANFLALVAGVVGLTAFAVAAILAAATPVSRTLDASDVTFNGNVDQVTIQK